MLIIKAVKTKVPVWFDGGLYERHLSHNNEVDQENHSMIYDRFYNN